MGRTGGRDEFLRNGPSSKIKFYSGMNAPATSPQGQFDPVRFEVIRNALLAITEEMGATLRRAAYSTNIKTRADFSCAFFDADLRAIAQAFAQPAHLGSLAHTVPQAIRDYGPELLQPGDGILINDPYRGGVHLNDITLIAPVFDQQRIFGYVANLAHHVDVGGGAPGSMGISTDIYQEGMVLPPVRFVKNGKIDRDLFNLIRANFRGTHEITGDFRAQTAANRLGVQRLLAMLDQYGVEELERYLEEILHYTERRTVAAFAQFPNGTFSAESHMDNDGVSDWPVKLAAAVHIDNGRIQVDLTGCDEQRPSPTNATSSQTFSGVVYVLKCLIDSDIPVNDGFYRRINIKTRPGTVVEARHPAAVAGGWEVAMQICDLLFKTLAGALPDRVLAGAKGCICNIAFGGINPRTGKFFTYYETIAGGYGATRTNDGMDAVQAHFQNTENAPIEEIEMNYPVRIVRYELIDDSEGPGRQRGGLGLRRDYAFPGHTPSFSILSDKAVNAPNGLFGGGDARTAQYILNPGDQARILPSKITLQLEPDDVVSVQTPGGGGCEPAWQRVATLVAEDVALGKISADRALETYGVVLHPETSDVDEAATQAERARISGTSRA